jgi:hypothetical protein
MNKKYLVHVTFHHGESGYIRKIDIDGYKWGGKTEAKACYAYEVEKLVGLFMDDPYVRKFNVRMIPENSPKT